MPARRVLAPGGPQEFPDQAMKTVVEILVCVLIVSIEIAVIVAIFAPQALMRPVRSLRSRRPLRSAPGTQ
jgi:hypothetical protein